MLKPRLLLALATALPVLAGCARSGYQRANPVVVADCRAQVDRVYSAQNRVELSRQDERDEPFAAGYVSGIVTRGLSARYARDNMVDSCVKASGGPAQAADPGTGSTFSPTAQPTQP